MDDFNIVIVNEHHAKLHDLTAALFGAETVNLHPSTDTMFDILVRYGAFSSKGQARKNWKQTGMEVPPGFNHFRVGRKQLWIWSPVEVPDET